MKPYEKDEEIEIDLLELAQELLSKWYLILLAAILVGALAFGYARFFVQPVYSSTSTMFVLSKSTSITSMADIQVGTSLTKDYEEVVTSRPVLDTVIRDLNLDTSYSALVKKLSVSNPTNTRFLRITVTDKDVNLAKAIADEVADVSARFISEKMDQDPPNILHYGYTDGERVNRSPAGYALIGALLGVVIACAIITLVYLLDDTITTPDDLEKITGLNVLATLPLEK